VLTILFLTIDFRAQTITFQNTIACSVSPDIVQQTPTKAFLPPDTAHEQLSTLSLTHQIFLVKHSTLLVFAKLNLYGFNENTLFYWVHRKTWHCAKPSWLNMRNTLMIGISRLWMKPCVDRKK
jgi:hypothetical protein